MFYSLNKRNILLTKDNVVKIGDLGISKLNEKTLNANTFAGTKCYMSPEQYKCILDENQTYSYNTDIW